MSLTPTVYRGAGSGRRREHPALAARKIDSVMTVTGRDIIEEVVERMRTESEPLRYSALAHGVYRVFLHREDYERLSPARRSVVEGRAAPSTKSSIG